MRTICPFVILLSGLCGQTMDHATLARELNEETLRLRAKQSATAVDAVSREAIEHAEKAGDSGLLAKCLHNRAQILRELHRYEEAEPLHRRTISLLESSRASPESLAISIHSLASLLTFQHRPAEAEPLLRQALRLPLRQKYPLALTLLLNGLGQVQYALGQDVEAEATFKRALAVHVTIRETAETDGGDHLRYTLVPGETSERLWALILNNQGLVAYRLGKLRPAEQCWRQSIDLYRKTPGIATGAVGAPMANLGELLRLQKQFPEAAEQLTAALSIFETTLGPDSYRVALVLNLLGNTLSETGDLAQARRLYNRSLALTRKHAGEEHSQNGVVLSNLAELEVREGSTGRALELYTRSLEILEKSLGPNHPILIPTLMGQVALLRQLGRSKDAKLTATRLNSLRAGSVRSGIVSLEDLRQER